jgi:hypothetical protein
MGIFSKPYGQPVCKGHRSPPKGAVNGVGLLAMMAVIKEVNLSGF